jgi:hypothetical protein
MTSLIGTLPKPKKISLWDAILLAISIVWPKARPLCRWLSEQSLTIFGLGMIDAGAFSHSFVIGCAVTGVSLLLFDHKLKNASA